MTDDIKVTIKKTPHECYETFKENHRDNIICECGSSYNYFSKSKHLKSNRHLKNLLGYQKILKDFNEQKKELLNQLKLSKSKETTKTTV